MDKSRALELIRAGSTPLEPLPAVLPREWLAGIPDAAGAGNLRAVLFVLYGTLFISASGDISAAGDEGDMGEFFRREVRRRHEQSGKSCPEVRVEEIWRAYSGPLPRSWKNGEDPALPEDPEEIALRYELSINPVYPMPFALEAINALREKGMILGIISNAQFFSPLLFDAFFGLSPEELGFDPELLIYSFKMGEAKPSPLLFRRALQRLAVLGVNARETLYVGNDMLKDIVPAGKAGFKTALFAGDLRSLRLRNTECAGQRPDLVIRDLSGCIQFRSRSR
jgi:putative hydrolase of the HAD superfamily